MFTLRTIYGDWIKEFKTKEEALEAANNCLECDYVEWENIDKKTGECIASAIVLRKKENWKVFYNKNTMKEYCSYSLFGEAADEEEATKELIAAEHKIDMEEIETKIEMR